MDRCTLTFASAGTLVLAALILQPLVAAGGDGGGAGGPDVALATRSDGAVQLRARLARPFLPVGESEAFLLVDAAARMAAERAPVRLALVMDRSGSMQGPKLEEVKRAARHLLSRLTEQDRLALIHYGSDVVALPELPVTPENRARMLAFVESIHEEGGTNLSAALEAALLALSGPGETRARRILLLSDGSPTEGLEDHAGLFALAGRVRERGLALSAFGVGLDFKPALMRGLAQRGGGSYAELRDATELTDALARELERAASTVAHAPELSLSLPPHVAVREVVGVAWRQEGGTVRVPLPELVAGGSARVVVRLRVKARTGEAPVNIAGVALHYEDARSGLPHRLGLGVRGTGSRFSSAPPSLVDPEAVEAVSSTAFEELALVVERLGAALSAPRSTPEAEDELRGLSRRSLQASRQNDAY